MNSPGSESQPGLRQLPVLELLAWGDRFGRTFPWRDPAAEPFAVLVAEVLLRKTRAESVVPVWRRLLATFPTPCALAEADEDLLGGILRPLGLNRVRAHQLTGLSRTICEQFGGRVPSTATDLKRLPGVGRYGSSAITLLLGYEAPAPVDANIARIISRFYGLAPPREIHKAEQYWRLVSDSAPIGNTRAYTLALIDLGALVCRARQAHCSACPLRARCAFSMQTDSVIA